VSLWRNSRTTDSLGAATSPTFLHRLTPRPPACTTNLRNLVVPLRFWRADFSPRGASAPLSASEAEASRGLKPALRDLIAAMPRCALARISLSLALLLLTACERAPSFDIVGSFFPAWLVCLSLAIVLTAVARWLLARMRIVIAVPILTYPSLAALFTFALWLAFFR
jgi:hypothetical protein